MHVSVNTPEMAPQMIVMASQHKDLAGRLRRPRLDGNVEFVIESPRFRGFDVAKPTRQRGLDKPQIIASFALGLRALWRPVNRLDWQTLEPR